MKIKTIAAIPCFFMAVCHTASADIIAYDTISHK